jgi:hypothetical protein
MKNYLPRAPLSVLLLTLTVCVSVFAQTLVFQGRVVGVADGDTVIAVAPLRAIRPVLPFDHRLGIDGEKGNAAIPRVSGMIAPH